MSFIRIKRHLHSEPEDILVLGTKKARLEDATPYDLVDKAVPETEVKAALTKIVDRTTKVGAKEATAKARSRFHLRGEFRQEESKTNRFRVVNSLRGLDDPLPVIDVVKTDADANENYVYDIYYSDSKVPFTEPDDYEVRDMDEVWRAREESDLDLDDSDDSNDECNWRNDYPDEEELDEGSDDAAGVSSLAARLNSAWASDASDFDDEDGYLEDQDGAEYHYINEVVGTSPDTSDVSD